ncbi:hypothetical protein [Bradyrhizobium barranii]
MLVDFDHSLAHPAALRATVSLVVARRLLTEVAMLGAGYRHHVGSGCELHFAVVVLPAMALIRSSNEFG